MNGEAAMHNGTLFKTCPMCAMNWGTRVDFLHDRTLKLNGYQADFDDLESGLFLFTHTVDGCCTTMAVRVRDFIDLYSGDKFEQRKTGTEECPGYCLYRDRLEPCGARCECAFVREIIQIILNFPKIPA
ncbi:MAG: hypothetical protein RBR09_00445 [Desulfobulbaceae bacterium]|jgi:hypothetical protein|nr:hypothetical protein [Desulfobulbaceae bacterium]MDY0349699.1 hypothetical protein [Desulfobulbaceae bacterium]